MKDHKKKKESGKSSRNKHPTNTETSMDDENDVYNETMNGDDNAVH
jgi:hypothetical protein